MNRTSLDKVRTKFAETNLPRELWGEAIKCSAYELNRSPTNANFGIPPATKWYNKNDISKLRVFGSRAWMVKLPKTNKLDLRADPGIMVEYYGGGYILWNMAKKEIICSRDVTFDENTVELKEEFQAKELGEIKDFLGMEIYRDGDTLKITQRKQIEKILRKFKMIQCKGTKTPMVRGFQVDLSEEIIDVPYRELIGSLMFISTSTRPDITYATSYLSQFLDKPAKSAWKEAKRVLRYLNMTKTYGLNYTKNSDVVKVKTYSDADWTTNK